MDHNSKGFLLLAGEMESERLHSARIPRRSTHPSPLLSFVFIICALASVTITMRDRHRAPGLSKKVPLTPKIVVPEKTKQRIIEKLKFGYRRFAKAGKPMYWTLSESLRRALYHEIQSPKLRERLMSLPNLMNPNASRIAEEQRRKFLKLDEKEENDKHLELKLKLNRSRTRERVFFLVRHREKELPGYLVASALQRLAQNQPDEEQGKKPALLAAIKHSTGRCANRLLKRALLLIKKMNRKDISTAKEALVSLRREGLVWFPFKVYMLFQHWEDIKYRQEVRSRRTLRACVRACVHVYTEARRSLSAHTLPLLLLLLLLDSRRSPNARIV